jgi:EmrB/QacA subfamily drug resistance transporter
LPAIALGTTLAPLNSTMIAVALPEIRDAFGVSVTATTLLVTLYLVAMAAGQPVGGRLGDLYGRRRVYLIGLAWFGIASAGCAFAPNLEWLIVFRTQQALAGTLSFPNGTAMIREAVPAARRATAFGTIGLATGIAAASGPPLGGALVHLFGWSAIFWANVPVVGLALLMGWQSLPRILPVRSERPRFDVAGTVLFAAALSAVIAIPALFKVGLPLVAIVAGLLGAVFGVAFVWWERRTPGPVVDVQLFRNRHFAAACATVGLSNLVMYTTLLALPLYLEEVRGEGVQKAGLVLAAMSVFSALLGPMSGRWTDRAGRWLPAVAGSVISLVGAMLLALFIPATSLVPIVLALMVTGVGLGVSMAPVQTAAVEAVPMTRTGSAAGIFSTSRYLGSVVGSTVLAAIFSGQAATETESRYIILFAGLAVVALAAVFTSTRVADRHHVAQS